MILKTIDFIREHGLDALATQFAIVIKRHPEFPNLVFLKYDQINSPMAEPICQECRGLILDEADDWRVISFPFRKFFNHGEGHAASIDWSTARVYEKLDGSLMTLYWYAGEWRVASNGTPDAGGPVPACGGTFAELFWRTWERMGYQLPDPAKDLLWMEHVFVFELMTPCNRVVVNHSECRLVLIGVRALKWDNAKDDPSDFCESEVGLWDHLGYDIVRSFPLNTADACVEAARHLDPLCTEGYVVCDANFNRIKIKSPQYVALAHLRDSVSPRRLLEIVRANESDEFLTYFPEFADAYNEVQTRFDQLCVQVDAEYAYLADAPTQKDFALQAVKARWSSALFDMRKGVTKTCREFAATCTMQSLERAIGLDADAIAALLIPAMGRTIASPTPEALATEGSEEVSPKEYTKSGKHLPDCLRDFHDAKDVFKVIHRTYGHERESNPYLKDLDWISAQVYTVDWFLWFMAQRGYTLQRSRANVEWGNLGADIESMKEEDAEAFRKMLQSSCPPSAAEGPVQS